MTTPTYQLHARNTLDEGSYCAIKPYDLHHVKYLTESSLKVALWQHLGYAYSNPVPVRLKVYQYEPSVSGWMVVVRKLTSMYSAPKSVRDRFEAEADRWFRLGWGLRFQVRGLHGINLNEFPILRPALTFLMQNFELRAEVFEDFGLSNCLWDERTDTIVPHDLFNIDAMERNN